MKVVATGAYGRATSQKDWNDGKDFKFHPDGPYFSKRDMSQIGRAHV